MGKRREEERGGREEGRRKGRRRATACGSSQAQPIVVYLSLGPMIWADMGHQTFTLQRCGGAGRREGEKERRREDGRGGEKGR